MPDINTYLNLINVAEQLPEAELNTISSTVLEDYDRDKNSRVDWEKRNEEGLKLAMQTVEAKNFPIENAANIKYPLVSIAAVQFAARAYPSIVQGRNMVKVRVTGDDPDGLKAARAMRVSEHMNYQLSEEMEEWEEDMDTALIILPIIGSIFKKTWFNPALGRNVSEFTDSVDFVVNYKAKKLEEASRTTQICRFYPNQIIERIRSGVFLDFEYGIAGDNEGDEDAPHVFLEQHRYLDLDKDGYKEPYIVTVHKDTQKVVRIVARWDKDGIKRNSKGQVVKIEPIQYYTHYKFMPAPDNSFYGWGFGSLIGPINRTINSTTNQLLDAGTIDNAGGGFIGKNVNLAGTPEGGKLTFALGEWKQINYYGDDLRKAFVPKPKIGASPVLFELLGFMVAAGEKLSSITEILTGEQSIHNEPATTTLARIEQGLKVFSAVYKRIHRSLKSEYKKLFRLNRLFLEEERYYTILDTQKRAFREDYNDKDCDVQPVSESTEVSNIQKLVKAQALFQLLGSGYNDNVIRRRYVEALGVSDIEELFEAQEPAPPDPKTMLGLQKLDLERDKHELELFKARFEVTKMQADTIKALAQAESEEIGPQLELYKTEMQALLDQSKKMENPKEKGVTP